MSLFFTGLLRPFLGRDEAERGDLIDAAGDPFEPAIDVVVQDLGGVR